jgi:YebC/PmpR family DNA-binding regulatory protein
MAGHSKWANIKNRKGAQDEKKGKIFGQLSRHIRSAVREHNSGDANANPALRLALDKARQANMPMVNVQRAIDRGLGKGAGGQLQEVTYEGYGPGGVGLLVIAVTDNLNRTSTDVRTAFSRGGGSLSGPGSVMYMFERGAEGEYVCKMPIAVEDETVQGQLEELIDSLREKEDVEEVFCAGVWEGQE